PRHPADRGDRRLGQADPHRRRRPGGAAIHQRREDSPMTRITNAVRERMCTDLLKRRFAPAGETLGQASAALFQRVYEERYDEETRRLMAKLKRKYRDAFRHERLIQCRAAGFRVDVGAVRLGHDKVTFTPTVEPRPFLNG